MGHMIKNDLITQPNELSAFAACFFIIIKYIENIRLKLGKK